MPAGRRSRRILLAALAATVVVVVLGAARPALLDRARHAAGTAFSPVLRWAGPSAGDQEAQSRERLTALSEQLRSSEQLRRSTARLEPLLASPALTRARVVAARVVAVGATGASGPQRVTVDAGARDGVAVDEAVVTAVGLVGRTVQVTDWTSDVEVLGSADLRVAVRAGTAGTLGLLTAGSTDGVAANRLSLRVVEQGSVDAGDVVTTLGSPGGRPFVPGLTVGTVSAVDRSPARVAATAAVRPAVDVTRLDVVGILLSPPRTTPRPATTAEAP